MGSIIEEIVKAVTVVWSRVHSEKRETQVTGKTKNEDQLKFGMTTLKQKL